MFRTSRGFAWSDSRDTPLLRVPFIAIEDCVGARPVGVDIAFLKRCTRTERHTASGTARRRSRTLTGHLRRVSTLVDGGVARIALGRRVLEALRHEGAVQARRDHREAGPSAHARRRQAGGLGFEGVVAAHGSPDATTNNAQVRFIQVRIGHAMALRQRRTSGPSNELAVLMNPQPTGSLVDARARSACQKPR